MTSIAPEQLDQLRELRDRLRAQSEGCRTRKVRFPDQAAAERRLATVDQTRDRVPRRVYQCPHCHDWHLTARDGEEVGDGAA